jgi:hypothetical protein
MTLETFVPLAALIVVPFPICVLVAIAKGYGWRLGALLGVFSVLGLLIAMLLPRRKLELAQGTRVQALQQVLVDQVGDPLWGPTRSADYGPFLAGVLVLGGLAVAPLAAWLFWDVPYLSALPWALGNTVVYAASWRRDGKVAWKRFLIGLALLLLAVAISWQVRGKDSSAFTLGLLPILFVGFAGLIGVAAARLYRALRDLTRGPS